MNITEAHCMIKAYYNSVTIPEDPETIDAIITLAEALVEHDGEDGACILEHIEDLEREAGILVHDD